MLLKASKSCYKKERRQAAKWICNPGVAPDPGKDTLQARAKEGVGEAGQRQTLASTADE